MKRIQESVSAKELCQAIEKLREYGFNPVYLASTSHDLGQLRQLSQEQVEKVRQIILEVPSNYYKRFWGGGKPYYKKQETLELLEKQTLERLASCLHTLTVLSETKAYVFWSQT